MNLEGIGKNIYAKLAKQNEARDLLINEMHEVLKVTREAISAIHRNELKKAEKSIENAQTKMKGAQIHLEKLSQLPVIGLVHNAEGEVAEAALFLAFPIFRIDFISACLTNSKSLKSEEVVVVVVCFFDAWKTKNGPPEY